MTWLDHPAQAIRNYSLSSKTELIGSRRWWPDRGGREMPGIAVLPMSTRHTATLPKLYSATVPYCYSATEPHCYTATVPHCSGATVPMCHSVPEHKSVRESLHLHRAKFRHSSFNLQSLANFFHLQNYITIIKLFQSIQQSKLLGCKQSQSGQFPKSS